MDLSLSNYWLASAVTATTVLLLLWWYAYFSKLAVLDQQDQRSMHQGRTITGAGILMFIPFSLGGLALYPLFIPLYIITALSVLGFVDDRHELSFQLRLMLQVAAALITLYIIGFDVSYGVLLFLVLCLLWWVNLFNFMDGANGMAGLHALVALGFYGWIFNSHFTHENVFHYLTVAGLLILLVYLIFNLWLNKLFMGDSGSLPLAWLIATMALYSMHYSLLTQTQIATLHAVFIVDATWTLFNRIRLGENITKAHASHLYQRLIKNGFTHVKVSMIYAMATLLCVVLVWFTLTSKVVVQYAVMFLVYMFFTLIFMKYLNTGR